MIIALLFLIFSAVVPIASFLSVCLKGLLFVLNRTVEIISYLPYAVIDNIRFSQIHLIGFLLVILILIVISSFYKIKRNIYYLIGLLAIILLVDIVNFHSKENRKELIFYNVRNNAVISLIDGHKHILLVESSDMYWAKNKQYLENYWTNREIRKHLQEISLNQIQKHGTVINYGEILMEMQAEGLYMGLHDRSMLLVTGSSMTNERVNVKPLKVDMLLITGNSGFPQGYHHKAIDPKKLIMFGNMNSSLRKAWKTFANSRDIEIYSIYYSGALHEIF
jgi:hypothetical protein